MADLTIEELQAFNDTQREIIEKQQAEIEQLRDHIKFLNSFRPDAELARLRGELASTAVENFSQAAEEIERLHGCIVKMRVAALISDWETFDAVYREALEE